jgi:hypothetical protein
MIKIKSKLGVVLALIVMSLGTVCSASASSILYYSDFNLGTDAMGQALTALSGANTVTTATSSADFATKISSGSYNLGVFSAQNFGSSSYGDGINALGAFVAGGGKAIYTDWSMDNIFAALFAAQWTGGRNQDIVTVVNPLLAAGISNPILLSNPGWGVYSMDVSGGSIAATFNNGNGAIAYSGNSIVNGFLTDTFNNNAQGIQLYENEINTLLGGGAAPVPEPGTMMLLGVGMFGLAVYGKRRKNNKV